MLRLQRPNSKTATPVQKRRRLSFPFIIFFLWKQSRPPAKKTPTDNPQAHGNSHDFHHRCKKRRRERGEDQKNRETKRREKQKQKKRHKRRGNEQKQNKGEGARATSDFASSPLAQV
jgi:hypothetical protein